MNRCKGPVRAGLALLPLLGLLLGVGCEVDKAPLVSALEASPTCGSITPHASSSYLEVEFFGLGTGGNLFGDPTGLNVPLKARWDFGDGGTAETASRLIHRYTTPGVYEATFTVEDNDGDEDSRSITVTVLAPEEFVAVSSELVGITPVRELVNDVLTIVAYNVEVTGSLSSGCPGAGIAVQFFWEWSWGDGGRPAQNTDNAVHRYARPAVPTTYDITLSITEFNSAVTQTSVIQVTLPPAP